MLHLTVHLCAKSATCPFCRRRELPLYESEGNRMCGACWSHECSVGGSVLFARTTKAAGDVLASPAAP